MNPIPEPLRELCALCGVRTEYHSIGGERHVAEVDILRRVLGCLGVAIAPHADDAALRAALDHERLARLRALLPPVIVADTGAPPQIDITLPAGASGPVSVTLRPDVHANGGNGPDGAQPLNASADVATLEHVSDHEAGGQQFVRRRLTLDAPIPAGYWQVSASAGSAGLGTARLVCAPPRAWQPDGGDPKRWGVFVPLYALHSSRSHGVADVTDLDQLRRWVESHGGSVIATLPLLASFNGEAPFEPSPYTPASRLFWNELYLDLCELPELAQSPRAQAMLESASWRDAMAAELARDHVDHAAVMRLKRDVIEEVLAEVDDAGLAPETTGEKQIPHLEEYARFRALCDLRRECWHVWPADAQALADADPEFRAAVRYHRYVQVGMRRQMRQLAERCRETGTALYVDQPLGIHPDSFDLWRWRDRFLQGLSCGAPPDPLATAGQDWGIPPLHPQTNREAGYDYVIDSLRHVMEVAGILRIDHIMQLHRIFTIPSGEKGDKGIYINYAADELWAIVRLESHRRQCAVIGEDLGTVPDEVRDAMNRFGVGGMSVMQFEIWNDADQALRPPPAHRVASVNTHDTPTWAGFWHGCDIDDRVVLGWQTPDGAAHEKQQREWALGALAEFLRRHGRMDNHATPDKVLRGALEFLALSPSPLVLVTLEDLWLEDRPQNVPGTWRERHNWQRRCAHPLDQFDSLPGVPALLRAIADCRRQS